MKNTLLFYFMVLAGSIILFSWVMYPSGSPGGKSGSPGDGGATCTQCHTGTAQQASGWITADIPAEGYIAGETYTVTATGVHDGVGRFGFEVTAEDAGGTKQGTLIITDATQTKLVNANKAVTHTSSGTTPFLNMKTWSFDWTAPAAGTGQITFYAAFNAANGNGSTSGDVIYVTSAAFPENTGVGTQEDLIAAAGLKIFPNPASDHADITWNNSTHPVRSITVFTMAGAQMASYTIEGQQAGRLRLPAHDMAPGMYVARVIFADDRQASTNLVKR